MESLSQVSGGKLCTHLIGVDLASFPNGQRIVGSNTCRVSGTPTRGRSLVEETRRYATRVCVSTKAFGYGKSFLDPSFLRAHNQPLSLLAPPPWPTLIF